MKFVRLSQILLLIINALFLLLGLAIISIGIFAIVIGQQFNITNEVATSICPFYLEVSVSAHLQFLLPFLDFVAVIIVGTGVGVFSIIGFIGTWKIARLLLYVVFFFLFPPPQTPCIHPVQCQKPRV